MKLISKSKALKVSCILLLVGALLSITACTNATPIDIDDNEDVENVELVGDAEEVENFEGQAKPLVTIEMETGGIIEIELYPEVAPNTVKNFVSLIENGHYDGLIFHRVIPGFMIQGGDPNGNGSGGPGYAIEGEFLSNQFENNLLHERGVISMARSQDPNSAGSQFFIMTEKASHLDGDYAGFGQVVTGMDVVDEIVHSKTGTQDKPVEDQKMQRVTVDTFDVNYEAPKIIQ
ncbi:Peptidylprolyl isomerase [Alkaliphilus metalliredigens QYMF]|uniref:Peptidyl-prolyl cis-trans isomerase n=2 Tax=Alkaliphilus TaxID=114627 RepID=A6TMR9_ALKMQ|nr:peptidylprolyl isomerase [Alkaliphilus metalliredigens]ABR47487.1 Peptidylprolyl isomerase [Alkaliphilus metalliredigens QYMF]